MVKYQKNLTKKYDPSLTVCLIFLIFIGFCAIASATSSLSPVRYLSVQAVAAVIGIALLVISMRFDYEYFGRLAVYIYGVSVALLVLVLFIGVGDEVGTRGWIRFGFIGIQPSELIKIGFIITFAKHITTVSDINKPSELLKLLLHAGIIIGLILLQPDYGTAAVFVVIMFFMLVAAGLNIKYILGAVGAVAVIAPVMWFFVLKDFQKNRVFSFLNPESDPLGAGYHVSQAKIAIGSGKVLGNGLFKGIQTQLGYLPEKQTDFVFAVIGEEMGFWGTILVLTLLVCVILRCFNIAKNARDLNGKLLCVGVGAMLLFHTFENIGMCIGLAPVTGIPLPFISYGGSNLITSFLAIALVMNVSFYSRRN
ncbi:MAG: rod shape-determining protein RodA [Clostridia bacterium]|nr:rod shape-determining protein RodA [Clostridia bacterium]